MANIEIEARKVSNIVIRDGLDSIKFQIDTDGDLLIEARQACAIFVMRGEQQEKFLEAIRHMIDS